MGVRVRCWMDETAVARELRVRLVDPVLAHAGGVPQQLLVLLPVRLLRLLTEPRQAAATRLLRLPERCRVDIGGSAELPLRAGIADLDAVLAQAAGVGGELRSRIRHTRAVRVRADTARHRS